MRKEVIFLAVAASCMLAACAKEIKEQEAVSPVSESVPEEETVVTPPVHREGWTYIGADNGEKSKASLDEDVHFTWNTGDQIAVFSGDTYHVSSQLDVAYNNQDSAVFAFEGNIDGDRTDFAVFPASIVHDGESVRSGSASNHTASSLVITLPSTYTIDQVKDYASPVPMIALNEQGQGLSFKRICGLLRITLANVPKPTESISLSFSGRKVNGTFTLSDVNLTDLESFKGAISVPATEAADSVITITGISLNALTKDYVINVPVPVGVTSDAEYKEVTVTTRDHEGHKINSFRAPIKTSGNWVPKRTTNRTLSVTLPVFTVQGNIGFNNGTKVIFAPGNLQATITSKATVKSSDGGTSVLAKASNYRFATHQYDYIGATNGNRLTGANQAVDLFNWTGASADPVVPESDPETHYLNMTEDQYGLLYPSLNSAGRPFFYAKDYTGEDHPKPGSAVSYWYYYTGDWDGTGSPELLKMDWGERIISDEVGAYPAGTWRTPNIGSNSTAEWQRVFTARKDPALDNALIDYLGAKATLTTNAGDLVARGVIIFPDSYDPTGMPAINNHSNGTIGSSHYAGNELTLAQWDQLEAVGCVFLPANNIRQSNSGVKLYNDGDCAYWANYAVSGSSPKASCFFTNDTDLVGTPSSDTIKAGLTITSMDNKTGINPTKGMGRQYGCGVRLIRDVN